MGGYQLFLLAHPDDDLFVRPLITADPGQTKIIVYLTNGRVPGPVTHEQRQKEVVRALANTSVTEIVWVGIEANVDVYRLPHRIADAYGVLGTRLAGYGDPGMIVTHAWEGGHPDHDAAHLIARALAKEAGIASASRTAPYYRTPRAGPAPFVVMSPLTENGPVEARPLSWREIGSMIAAVRHYPSQLVPMAGLTPGMIANIVAGRQLHMQRLDCSPAPARPMPGKLLYERRNDLSFEDFSRLTLPFVQSCL